MQAIQKGFTLIELLVTLAVSIFLLTVGVPTLQTLLNSSERTTKVNELITSMNLARSEALKRGTPISMCRVSSKDKTNCSTSACDKITHKDCWESGWLVFTDENNSGKLDAGEERIRTYSFDPPKHSLITKEYTDSITFGTNGETSVTGMFTYCVDWNGDGDLADLADASNWIAVILNLTGRPKLSTDINGDGLHDDHLGNSLACI